MGDCHPEARRRRRTRRFPHATVPSPSLRLRMTNCSSSRNVRVSRLTDLAMRMISRGLGFLLLAVPLAAATTVDRIAAVVDRQVITVSEVSQMVALHFFARAASTSEDDFRHEVLESLIAQALRFRDVERFGAEDVPKD